MFKQRSHDTHHGTHIPEIEARPGECTIALLGDSLFERFKTTGQMLSINKESHILNLGVGGDKVLNVQYRINQGLLKSLKEHQTNLKHMYIHMGSNNLKPSGLRPVDAEDYDKLIKQLRTEFPDVRIAITALFLQRNLGAELMEDINKTLKTIASENGCEFLPFGDDQEGIMSDDNVHLNQYGYTKWNDILINDMSNH